MPRYPDIEVQLTGEDGNAFQIIMRVAKALYKHEAPPEDIKEFISEAKSGDYNHVLVTCLDWVECL